MTVDDGSRVESPTILGNRMVNDDIMVDPALHEVPQFTHESLVIYHQIPGGLLIWILLKIQEFVWTKSSIKFIINKYGFIIIFMD